MVQIPGKYQHVSNSPEYEGYIKALGGPEDVVKAMVASKPIVTISESGGSWTMVVSNAGKDATSTFKLGETFTETLPNGVSLKSVARKEGDKIIIDSTFNEAQKGTRVYEFTASGITVHLLDDKANPKATRTYKRI